jgi:hypothetical protein
LFERTTRTRGPPADINIDLEFDGSGPDLSFSPSYRLNQQRVTTEPNGNDIEIFEDEVLY